MKKKKLLRANQIVKIGVGVAVAFLTLPMIAFAAGSDSPTPYTVTEEGVTLPSGGYFEAHGHVNIRTDKGSYGIHFDPYNNQPGGVWIGKDFIPWSAFGLEGEFCVEWVQINNYNEHFGEGNQEPVCVGKEIEEPEKPEEPETPETPEIPETPEVPEEPEEPEVPETPETPETPVTPEEPKPETPKVPKEPTAPETPETPEAPESESVTPDTLPTTGSHNPLVIAWSMVAAGIGMIIPRKKD